MPKNLDLGFLRKRVYYESAEMGAWCHRHRVHIVWTAPYRHCSLGAVERFHKTLVDRIRKLRLAKGGVWTDYVADAVHAMNNAVHSTTKSTPEELWRGTRQDRLDAQNRSIDRRAARSARQRYRPVEFHEGDLVLAFDELAEMKRSDKFAPRWRGPFRLSFMVSWHIWKVEEVDRTERRGRAAELTFHVDQLQPFVPL